MEIVTMMLIQSYFDNADSYIETETVLSFS